MDAPVVFCIEKHSCQVLYVAAVEIKNISFYSTDEMDIIILLLESTISKGYFKIGKEIDYSYSRSGEYEFQWIILDFLAFFGPAGKGPLRSLDTKGHSDGKDSALIQRLISN